ncbi:MAG: IS5 family transposase ISAzo31 [Turneriella sp.]|nr:IS5 family transposase ISAzo31 [Turneriella sp.]
MRGDKTSQMDFLYNFSAEAQIPQSHPLRKIKTMADEALKRLDKVFDQMYADKGRASIPPERLLKASLLIAFYSIRSERQLCEQLEYNFLFRWFLDMTPNDRVPDHSTFAKNRQRLLEQNIAARFLHETIRFAQTKELVSDEHFTVDGTLIEAWASLKSFKAKSDVKKEDDTKEDSTQPENQSTDTSRNPSVNFHGEKRSNATHASTTDSDARLMRKGAGKEAKLSYTGNIIMENRSGLCVAANVEIADGTAERRGALTLLKELARKKIKPKSLGADKGYHTKDFVKALRDKSISPHIAMIDNRRTPGLDGRTRRSIGYQISQRLRKRVEELFGWGKTIGGIRKTRFKGRPRVGFHFVFTMAAANLVILAGLT